MVWKNLDKNKFDSTIAFLNDTSSKKKKKTTHKKTWSARNKWANVTKKTSF